MSRSNAGSGVGSAYQRSALQGGDKEVSKTRTRCSHGSSFTYPQTKQGATRRRQRLHGHARVQIDLPAGRPWCVWGERRERGRTGGGERVKRCGGYGGALRTVECFDCGSLMAATISAIASLYRRTGSGSYRTAGRHRSSLCISLRRTRHCTFTAVARV